MATRMSSDMFWRSPGPWMVAAGAALMLANALRAFISPEQFAAYLGLPLVNAADTGLVHVYALRALFIGVLAAALLLARQSRALSLFAVAAVVMPVGDAWLTFQARAPAATIGRHIGIALFLLTAAALLRRDTNRAEQEG
jgi:hypothetical protein